MKLAILTSVTILLTCMSFQCSRSSTSFNGGSGVSNNLSNSAQTKSASDKLKATQDMENWQQVVRTQIKRESAKLGIDNLRDASLGSESQIRIWVGFGLAYSRCIILRNVSGTREGIYVGPMIVESRAPINARKVSFTKKPLSAPKSGWDDLYKFLRVQGIESTIGLSSDEQFIPAPDGEIIVMEIKSGKEYSMAFFSLYTESEDGQKALNVCRKMEQEFGITMGCGYQK
jgi:hypothetical protein